MAGETGASVRVSSASQLRASSGNVAVELRLTWEEGVGDTWRRSNESRAEKREFLMGLTSDGVTTCVASERVADRSTFLESC